ncbi:hypothetical protein L1987_30685 [Smallanthus sonchifolius]|uniref:Uncharacterized protein n=1 Tax=Smallanthus sonchifolius TaxID=185202 RepID=A0ACB9I3H1_9ASTR|nr:hypothetical protein L1987_30685 [Smallanthus sonchifolius]
MALTHPVTGNVDPTQFTSIPSRSGARCSYSTFARVEETRLNSINTTIGYDGPIHVRVRGNTQDWDWYPDRIRNWIREEEVPPPLTTDIVSSSSSSSVRALPPLQYPYEQVIAAFVARMDREIRNMRDAAGEITSILQREMLMNQRITKMTADLAATDTAHENLANGCVDMEDRLNTAEWNLDILHTRIEQVDARLAAVEAAGVAPVGDEDEDDDAASDVTSIMSGRGNGCGGRAGGRGGRGNINMTAAELTALINERVAEAEAATHAAINAGVEPKELLAYSAGWSNLNPLLQYVQMLTLEMANALPWDEFKTMLREEYCPRDEVRKLEGEFWNLKMEGSEIEAYTTRSHEMANLCPQMVTPPYKRIEKFIDGLVPQIQSMVTSSNPTTIQQAIWLAHRLTDQAVAQDTLPPRGALSKTADNKRKFDSSFPKTFQSNPPSQQQQQQQQHRKFEPSKNNSQSNSSQQNQGSYVGKYPKCNKCNFHHHGACDRYRCQRCGKMGHLAKDCRVDLQNKQTPPGNAPKGCFECGKEWHFKKYCPQLRRNGNRNGNGNNHQGGNGNGNNHQGGNGNNNGNGAKG